MDQWYNAVLVNILDKHLRCPISKKIFLDPVIASDGFTYEKDSIYFISKSRTASPITKVIIREQLIPNLTFYNLIHFLFSLDNSKIKEQYVPESRTIFDDIYELYEQNDFSKNINYFQIEKHLKSNDTNDFYVHPVTFITGETFERDIILNHIKNDSNILYPEKLGTKFIPNTGLRNLIREYLKIKLK